jgi:PKD repeat protein
MKLRNLYILSFVLIGFFSKAQVPVSEFLNVKFDGFTNDTIRFYDASSNNPTSWTWEIFPDTVQVGSQRLPTYQFAQGNKNSENPLIRFLRGGKYTVCLTASNSLGSGVRKCKFDLIEIFQNVNMCDVNKVTSEKGFLFDDGGPNNPVSRNRFCNLLIDPCADTVYFKFNDFRMYCGYNYVRIFEGSNSSGRALHCTNNRFSNVGPGFTGGVAGNCTNRCFPRTSTTVESTPFQTYKAVGTMYLEYATYNNSSTASQSPGFAAEWWSIRRQGDGKPTANFFLPDSVCRGNIIEAVDQSIGSNLSYYWDYDGDLSYPEFTKKDAVIPFFADGKFTITLIVSNCGGNDTFVKEVYAYAPSRPSPDFEANVTNPFPFETVKFFNKTSQIDCIEKFRWKFKHSGTGKANFVNGTNANMQDVQVQFTDSGCYEVELYAENILDSFKNIKKCYVYVRKPYCNPSVSVNIPDIGISSVVLDTFYTSNSSQGTTDYTSFLADTAGTLEPGKTYSIEVKRTSNQNSVDVSVYIDWNADGDFNDPFELAASQSKVTTNSYKGSFTVPNFAVKGITVMRIATNIGGLGNKECGTNKFGEFEDYKVIIQTDLVPPVITLIPPDTQFIPKAYIYYEPGFTASDNIDGNITNRTSITWSKPFNSNSEDTFYRYYNVSDIAGNRAQQKVRVVIIGKDQTPPFLELFGDTFLRLRVGTPFIDPGVRRAIDFIDGDVINTLVINGLVNFNEPGFYSITYTVNDLDGNKATLKRRIEIYDDVKPTIALVGQSVYFHEAGFPWVDSVATATDNYDKNPQITILGEVNPLQTGVYKIFYKAYDKFGNESEQIERTVVVRDTRSPEIKLQGDSLIIHEVNTKFIDPGILVTDNYDKVVKAQSISGTFPANFPSYFANRLGTFNIIYSAQDSSGNSSSKTRTIQIKDETAPSMKLLGPEFILIKRWRPYEDAGYETSDNFNTFLSIDTFGDFTILKNESPEGIYSLSYASSDQSGNRSEEVTRYILVSEDPNSVAGVDNQETPFVYPNPAKDFLILAMPKSFGKTVKVNLLTIDGKLVKSYEDINPGISTQKLSLSNVANGIYLLNISSEEIDFKYKVSVVK